MKAHGGVHLPDQPYNGSILRVLQNNGDTVHFSLKQFRTPHSFELVFTLRGSSYFGYCPSTFVVIAQSFETPGFFRSCTNRHQTANANDAIMVFSHDPEIDREATNLDGIPAFPNSSTTAMFNEAEAQHIRETVNNHEADPGDQISRPDPVMKVCVACGYEDEERYLMTAPCGHTYCGKCVNKLFDRAAEYESNFPPKCCGQVITLEGTNFVLSPKTHNKFLERSEEFSTLNRTYCYDPRCATFIPPKASVGDIAKCPACERWTCIVCKGEAHKGNCPEDTAVRSFEIAVTEARFQRCLQCKRVIELTQGCNHIT